MAGSRRPRSQEFIWPGFVDALSSLLIVIIFLLMLFIVGQFTLNQVLDGRDQQLARLNSEISELADMLAMETRSRQDAEALLVNLQDELAASLTAQGQLEADLSLTRAELSMHQASVQQLRTDLEQAQERQRSAEETASARQDEIDEQLIRLSALRDQLAALEARRDELLGEIASRDRSLDEAEQARILKDAEAARINQQLAALREQLGELQALLDEYEERDREAKAQIANLGSRLNAALANKVNELAQYRSEFFGRLRQILGGRQDIEIVGDRFVFQSEILFAPASAELGIQGQLQMTRLANTLKEISQTIPEEVDWILQIEGHTDWRPINSAQFPSNWELSAARALSVVHFLEDQGIPADHLSAAGFGEHQPLDDTNGPAGWTRNRRIEIKFTNR